MTQIGVDGFWIFNISKSTKSADKVPTVATFAKQLYSGFSLMGNRQKTGFFPSLGQALGFVESQNH
jgi:hypothetical protein